MKTRQVKSLLIVPVLLLLITPAISSKEPVMEIFFAKYFWLTGIAVLLIPLLIIPGKKLPVTQTDLLVILFTGYIYSRWLLSTLPATDSRKITYFLVAALAYFAIKQTIPAGSNNLQRWLLATVFITAIVTGIYGILQKAELILPFNQHFPVTGTFFQPAAFAGFIAGIFPVACYTGYRLWKHDNSDPLVAVVKILALVTGCVIIFILPSVQSRAAVTGLIAGVVFMAASMEQGRLLLKRVFDKGRNWKLFLIAAALLILVIAGYSVRPSSANGRLLVWKISGKMILEKPLWGFGTDAFRSVYPDYQIAYFKSGNRPEKEKGLSCEVTGPFNEIIQFCCEWGIAGALLFALILVSVFSSETPGQTGAKAALVSWLVFGQFAYPFSLPELTLYFFIFLALADGAAPVTLLSNHAKAFERVPVVFITLVSLAVITKLVPTYKTWQGVKQWDKAVATTDSIAADKAFTAAFPLLKNNDLFLSDYAHHAFSLGRYKESIMAIQIKNGKLYDDLLLAGENCELLAMPDSAIAQYKDAAFLLPHRFTPLYKLMRLYEHSGDTSAASTVAKEIQAKPVKIESFEVYTIKQEASRLLHKGN